MNSLRLAALVDDLIWDIRTGVVAAPTFARVTDPRHIWFELAFCVTSSQERTRKAQHAARTLAASYDDLMCSDDVQETIKSSLNSAFVSLRFINRKTELLSGSWAALIEELPTLQAIDEWFETPAQAREYLIERFPGLGPKQSSMLLRNLGFGDDLAIIDSHIIRMSEVILQSPPPSSRYAALEGSLREFAAARDVSLQTLDVVLWTCSRHAPRNLEERLLV